MMFNPAGAVIQAILAVYNTIKFFAERATQLAELASSVFDSIESIASGSLTSAITAVVSALARSVPVGISLLARLLGLADIAAPIRQIMIRVGSIVDGVIDRGNRLVDKDGPTAGRPSGAAVEPARNRGAKGPSSDSR